ncbi:MAG: tRNA(fMet)-specific endonuclease VapC [Methylococcales bacterium]|nr:tRNA(fMet)-specific endonuclease VapC [Methylococcales bacterium]
MLKYLLDTNIVIYVIKQRPIEALAMFNKQHGRMAISAITLAELVHGAEKSQFPTRNLAVVEDFCSRLIILPYGDIAAYHYGSIRTILEQTGKTIGVNDLHIAAQARSQGLVLVSNNLREFERVPGLLLENWVA